ncbi:hypothetical protein LEP1GSC199_1046 [Leptospira vanthielii serovar Holland str. Waz Holland = ATCC 700522]|uniref:Uncharacterized protein n=1 Tax=Leptospira vanthielii serovar Holland str. Waz Holland = ATCC 700522 TaxID=1218591 RepID=N1W8Q9_9LEPT|nr:hypothetical protein LEP1GSC199_1046 [Leptospira vanthielii serovar Holland str. Waz Holland = ATCC 700522]
MCIRTFSFERNNSPSKMNWFWRNVELDEDEIFILENNANYLYFYENLNEH